MTFASVLGVGSATIGTTKYAIVDFGGTKQTFESAVSNMTERIIIGYFQYSSGNTYGVIGVATPDKNYQAFYGVTYTSNNNCEIKPLVSRWEGTYSWHI